MPVCTPQPPLLQHGATDVNACFQKDALARGLARSPTSQSRIHHGYSCTRQSFPVTPGPARLARSPPAQPRTHEGASSPMIPMRPSQSQHRDWRKSLKNTRQNGGTSCYNLLPNDPASTFPGGNPVIRAQSMHLPIYSPSVDGRTVPESILSANTSVVRTLKMDTESRKFQSPKRSEPLAKPKTDTESKEPHGEGYGTSNPIIRSLSVDGLGVPGSSAEASASGTLQMDRESLPSAESTRLCTDSGSRQPHAKKYETPKPINPPSGRGIEVIRKHFGTLNESGGAGGECVESTLSPKKAIVPSPILFSKGSDAARYNQMDPEIQTDHGAPILLSKCSVAARSIQMDPEIQEESGATPIPTRRKIIPAPSPQTGRSPNNMKIASTVSVQRSPIQSARVQHSTSIALRQHYNILSAKVEAARLGVLNRKSSKEEIALSSSNPKSHKPSPGFKAGTFNESDEEDLVAVEPSCSTDADQCDLKLVVFDFDCTLTTKHVFGSLAGLQDNSPKLPVPPPHARTEKGQLERLHELDADPSWGPGVLALKAFGGTDRLEELRHLLETLRRIGVECAVLSRGMIQTIRRCLSDVNLLSFFSHVFGSEGCSMGFTSYDQMVAAREEPPVSDAEQQTESPDEESIEKPRVSDAQQQIVSPDEESIEKPSVSDAQQQTELPDEESIEKPLVGDAQQQIESPDEERIENSPVDEDAKERRDLQAQQSHALTEALKVPFCITPKANTVQRLMEERRLSFDQTLFIDDDVAEIENVGCMCKTMLVSSHMGIQESELRTLRAMLRQDPCDALLRRSQSHRLLRVIEADSFCSRSPLGSAKKAPCSSGDVDTITPKRYGILGPKLAGSMQLPLRTMRVPDVSRSLHTPSVTESTERANAGLSHALQMDQKRVFPSVQSVSPRLAAGNSIMRAHHGSLSSTAGMALVSRPGRVVRSP